MANDAMLGLKMELEISHDASVFGLCISEQYDAVDLAENLDKNPSLKKSNLFYMPHLGYIQRPGYYSQDTLLPDWDVTSASGGTPDQNWIQGKDAETQCQCLLMTDATPGNSFSAESTDTFALGQPGWLKIGRGLVSANQAINTLIELSTDATPDDTGAAPIKIVLNQNEPPRVEVGVPNNEGGWAYRVGAVSKKYVKSQDIFAGSSRETWVAWWSFNTYNAIVIYLAGEYLLIKGTLSQTTPIGNNGSSITVTQPLELAAGKIKVSGDNGTAMVAYFPMTFTEVASITNGPFVLDYVYSGNGRLMLPNSTFPSGTSYSYKIEPYVNPQGVADTTGTVIQYTLQLTSTTYTTTPTIPSIHLYIPPVVSHSIITEPPLVLTEADIIEVNEHSYEDRAYAQNEAMGGTVGWGICNEAYFRLTNQAAQWTAGLGGDHHCYSYSRALTAYDPATNLMVPIGPMVQHSTGFTGFQSLNQRHDPYREFQISCSDKTYPLKRVGGGAQLFLDGWCCFSAMRYQLEKSGVVPSYIDTASSSGFYSCDFGPNPPGCTHPKLPINTLMAPSYAFPMEQKYWSNLLDLAGFTYDVIWFDPQGVAHRISYDDAVAQAPSMGTFTTASNGDITSPSFGCTAQNIQISVDTMDKRTAVTSVGLDAGSGTQRQAMSLKLDSQPGYADYTAKRHGFNDGLYVASKRFIDPAYQVAMTHKMLQKAMLPNLYVEMATPFLPNSMVYQTFTLAEGSVANNYTSFASNQAITCLVTDRSATFRQNYNGIHELGQALKGRYIENVN